MAVLTNRTTWLRRGAFAAGIVAALTVVVLGRLPASGGALGLDATLTTQPTGDLSVARAGRVATAAALQPGGGELRAEAIVASQVDRPLAVRVRVRPSIADADGALHVRVRAGAVTLYDGPAGGLRKASRGAATIAPHGNLALDVRAWLPPRAPDGWEGRSVTLPLEYVTSGVAR
jgi:hypothetical protein